MTNHIPQVGKEHYAFERYGAEERFISYRHQLNEVLRLAPRSILEVGVGDGVFGNFIKQNTDIEYKSLDVAEDLRPDVVGSVTDIPAAANSVDTACAFEVLEHLPFDEFEMALAELSRVSRQFVVISLPHFGPAFSFLLKIPLLPELRFLVKFPVPKGHRFNGQHYWEIGKRRYSLRRIRAALGRHGNIVRDFVPFGSAYHHFFVLEKR